MLVLATFFDSDSLGGGTGDFNFLAVSGSRDSRKTLLKYIYLKIIKLISINVVVCIYCRSSYAAVWISPIY